MGVPLNRVPPGLLDFLGIKSGEWGPRELGQLLTPTMDLSRWYLDNAAIEVGLVINGSPFGAAGASNAAISVTTPVDLTTAGNLDVPQDESWLILEADLRWTTNDAAGAVAATIRSGAVGSGAGSFHWPMLVQGVNTGAAVVRAGCASLERPFWVLPGHRIEVFHFGILGAAASASIIGHMRFQRCRR